MDVVGHDTLEIMKEARFYNDWLFENIKDKLGLTTVEVGAGIGNFTALLEKKSKVTALDIDKEYIKNLKSKVRKNTRVGFGDIEHAKYFTKIDSFDSLVNMNVLEHIKDDKKALNNMNKLLKKGGKLILLTPAHQMAFGTLDENLGHFRRYSKKELTNKVKNAGFEIENVRFLNFLGIFGWFLNSRILKSKLIPSGQLGIFDKIARPFLKIEKYFGPPFGLSLLIIASKK